jgi:hypothetical protein
MPLLKIAMLLFAGAAVGMAASAPELARLKVTRSDLVPQCLDGKPVPSGTRSWDLPAGESSLVFSMRSQPRHGETPPDSGWAAITFTAEPGHRYEAEVRADATAFSTRAFRSGEWTPVVRDRTTDRVVSSTPVWSTQASCR